jgi:ABC-type dipeptide/oligopeptide/nickel transport system permease component
MLKYTIKRLLFAIPTILGVFIVVFLVLRLIPGDPAVAMLGKDATDEQIEIYREKYGLDKPLPVQLGIALKDFVSGDLGMSISHYQPVTQAIFERLPNTVELALLGILLSATLSIIFGVTAAVYRGRWPDTLLMTYSTIGTSMPSFYIGLWVLVIFARRLDFIPVLSNMEGVPHWKGLFGPLMTIALGGTATLMRTCRSSMLEIFNEDFIRTARAKGLSERVILFKHALGNAMIPLVTIVGYNLATSFGGAIMLETVFTRNGMGKLLVDAISVRDYPLIQGATVFIAILMILINILTDVVYNIVDPRIRVHGDT